MIIDNVDDVLNQAYTSGMTQYTNKMPVYDREKKNNRDQVDWEKQTAEYLQALWHALTSAQRQNAKFIVFMVQCGWINKADDVEEATRVWRNRNLAKLLKTDDDDSLTEAICKAWPRIDRKIAEMLITQGTGITNYYPPLRPIAIRYIKNHIDDISKAFMIVSLDNISVEEKIKRIFVVLGDDSYFKTPNGGYSSIINAISPSLACLDPNNEFPIMNQRTQGLLHAIGQNQDAEGAIALTDLISSKYNIKNAFELDVYSQAAKFPRRPRRILGDDAEKTIGVRARNLRIRSEENSYYTLANKRRSVTKEHVRIVNAFYKKYRWEYKIEDGLYDIFLPKYKKDRSLLIEVKTSSSGVNGRSQVRQAIGQLFDYRKTHFMDIIDKIDLAILLPNKPEQDIVDLLESLKINTLWFDRGNVSGTIII